MNNVYFLFISQHVFFFSFTFFSPFQVHLGSFRKENIQVHILTHILLLVHSFHPEPEKGHKTYCTRGLSRICSVLSVINIFRLSVCVICLSHILWHPDTMIEWCSVLEKSSGARRCVVMFSSFAFFFFLLYICMCCLQGWASQPPLTNSQHDDMRAKGLIPAFRTYIAQCYGCSDMSLIFICSDALFGPWNISGPSDAVKKMRRRVGDGGVRKRGQTNHSNLTNLYSSVKWVIDKD